MHAVFSSAVCVGAVLEAAKALLLVCRVLQLEHAERSGVHPYVSTAVTDAAATWAQAAAAVALCCWCCLDLPYGCLQLWQDLEKITHKAVVRQLRSSNGSNRQDRHSHMIQQDKALHAEQSSVPPTPAQTRSRNAPQVLHRSEARSSLHPLHRLPHVECRYMAADVALVMLIHKPKRATSHVVP